MARDMFVRNVRPMNADAIDLLVQDGRIIEAGTSLAAPDGVEVIDGGGRLLFPGLIDAHTHMDKTLIGMGWYRNEVGPTLMDKIENERNLRREPVSYTHLTLPTNREV